MSDGYISKVFPLIDRAASAARERAKRVIVDTHLLWMVYIHERERLLDAAAAVKNGKPMKNGESMTEEEFEVYLLSRGVCLVTRGFFFWI